MKLTRRSSGREKTAPLSLNVMRVTMNYNFDDLMEGLKTRGGMYIVPFNFDTLIAYLFGCEATLNMLGRESPLEGMRELVYCRFGAHRASVWPYIVRELLSKTEDDAIRMVFDWYSDLKAIRESRGLGWLRSEFERLGSLKRKRATNCNWPDKSAQHNLAGDD